MGDYALASGGVFGAQSDDRNRRLLDLYRDQRHRANQLVADLDRRGQRHFDLVGDDLIDVTDEWRQKHLELSALYERLIAGLERQRTPPA